ncbi:MAG: SET domain-containing protein-lysine N-methyltransferase [Terracidiphilus sp.]
MGLIIRSSAIHAAGCYATSAIRKGARVAEYTGPRLTKAEADACYDDLPITYLFGLGDGSIVIDGHCMAMFINHSCDPNCETDERNGRVWIRAIRTIAPGEEITYDYCLYDGDEDEAVCNCGAATCRGTMYSEEETRRRKAAARKAAQRSKAAQRKKTVRRVAKKSKKRRPRSSPRKAADLTGAPAGRRAANDNSGSSIAAVR